MVYNCIKMLIYNIGICHKGEVHMKKCILKLNFTLVFLSIFLIFKGDITLTAQKMDIPLYSADNFFTLNNSMAFQLMPDGQSLMFLAPADGIMNIFSKDIASGEEHQITFETSNHILSAFFKGDTLLYLKDTTGNQNTNIFRVNEDGIATNLTPFPNTAVVPISTLDKADNNNEIFVAMNLRNSLVFDIHKLNIFSGESSLLFEATDGILFDNDGVIRIISQPSGGATSILHRYNDDDKFEVSKVLDFDDILSIFAFSQDNSFVYALSNINRETVALVSLNPATFEELEVIFEHKSYDIASVISGLNSVIGGVIYHADYINIVFLDYETKAFYNEVLELLPQNTHIKNISTSQDQGIAIINTMSDISRGRSYLFDRKTGQMELLSDQNFTNKNHMAPMQSIRYIARDGLTVQAYLTLPVGIAPSNLPLVVIPHGGPWIRDTWGFNAEVQFLANRGYAVLQPNFRGSAGFGRSFLKAGNNEWGFAIQNDITDGVLWLIEQGIVDPGRVGIYGASFGGYAALAGAVYTPKLYAGVIIKAGVSNIFSWVSGIPPQWEQYRDMLYYRVGHPKHDLERLKASSPIFHLENITTPIFVAHGANDERAPLSEAVMLVESLQNRNADVIFMVRFDEGHGFSNQQNIIDFYSTMEAFFAEHLGGRTASQLSDINTTQYISKALEFLNINTEQVATNETQYTDVLTIITHDSAYWGLITHILYDIPLNIDGFQGVPRWQSLASSDYTGKHILTVSNFIGDLKQINISVQIGQRQIIYVMGLKPDEYFKFYIYEEDVPNYLQIFMSTNGKYSGSLAILIKPFKV